MQRLREKVECLVVGAGVVGLAVARQLALDGRSVLVVEAQSAIGTGASSRNSEVIHAGIYYPPGSLKAKLCVEGRRSLFSYCRQHGIPHKRVGKLVVANSPHQAAALERLEATGKANGVQHLRMLSAAQATRLEPRLHCVQALWSPSTGILDSHAYMLSLQAAAEERGAMFAFNTTVLAACANASDAGIDVFVHDTASARGKSIEEVELVLAAKFLINCGGLHAQAVARSIQGVREESIPKIFLARGNYFRLQAAAPPFSRLVYPLPEQGGLGVHLTLDLAGQVRFGPDVEWLQADDIDVTTELDYGVDPARAEKFYAEIRKYYPGLPDDCLVPDYAGIRSKLSTAGSDFVIQNEGVHGVHGLINLFGIESPGLTASLALGKMVSRLVHSYGAGC